jgi:hypothetical protein
MDFFEVGDKTALICTDSTTGEVVRSSLRELNFKFHTAESPELAIERIRYTPYDIIVIQENFAGSSLKSNPVLAYLTPLPMAQRRHSMSCLIGPSFKTLDAMQAFAQSVHFVVNPIDLPNFTAILKKGYSQFESLYKVYKDVFASLGQK